MAVAGAETYTVQTCTSITFSLPTETAGLIAPTLDLTTLTPGTTYYWRAKAVSAAGESPWSATRLFTVYSLNTPSTADSFFPSTLLAVPGEPVYLTCIATDPEGVYSVQFQYYDGAAWQNIGPAPR